MIIGFSKYVMEMIRRNFKDADKFRVIDETKIYRKMEDKSIWEQKKGKQPSIAEVWFDNHYLCDVRSDMRPDQALALIQFKLLELLKVKS